MAYGVKYRTEYNRRGGGLTTIDILANSYAGAIAMLTPDGEPLIIDWVGDVNNIYYPTCGTGATIKVFATPLTMMDLMTSDPLKFMVIVYDGASGTTVRWQGFVSADIYGENYSYATTILIPITIQCTDGISLLDNIKYTESDGTFYAGLSTLMDVIGLCIVKLPLTFQGFYTNNTVLVDTTENELLYGIEIFQENFIDESREAMSCRQVINSIVGGLGLVMFWSGQDIYLIDPIDLHDPDNGWSYNAGAYSLGGYLDISLKEITWGETDSQLDVVPSFPEALIKYDPYNFYEYPYNFADSKNWFAAGTFSNAGIYELNSTIEYEGWTVTPSDYMTIASRKSYLTDPEYMLMFNNGGAVASHLLPNIVISGDGNLLLKISMQVYVQTQRSDANIFDSGVSKVVNRLLIPFAVKVGGYWWEGGVMWNVSDANKWNPFWVYGSEMAGNYLSDTINDKWVTCNTTVPIFSPLLIGDITVELYDEFSTTFTDPILPAAESFFSGTISKSSSFIDPGTTFTHVNNTTIQITLDNFSTYLGLPAGSAVDLTLIACVNPNNAISGTYLDAGSNSHNFASDFSNSLFYITSYTPATDALIYTIVTNGTPYFNNDFDHFTFGALGPLNYTVGYRSVLAFVKDIKIEVIDNYSRENIGNPGVEKKGILSTNLTGKSPFELTTTSGTGTNGASRGAFKSVLNDGENIAGFNRVGESMVYDTADFILQNVVSQYKDARFKITGAFDTIGQPINLRTKLIKDTDYLGARAFYIISGSYQDQEELLSFEMIEIEDTRESIDDLDNPLPT